MSHTVYEYPATDTANDAFDSASLDKEVRRVAYGGSAFAGLTIEGVGNAATAYLTFTNALSAPDEAVLDAIIANHAGIPTVRLSTPREIDGKPVVVITPGTVGWLTYFHGAGDTVGPPVSRGSGQAIQLSFTGTGTQSIEWQYAEPIELHDGQMRLEGGWSVRDTMDFCIRLPATPAVANGTNTGNVFRQAIGAGIYRYVPAPLGNGDYDIDLNTAVPVPSRPTPIGYWDCDYDTGALSVSPTPGSAKFNLLSFEVKVYLMRKFPIGGGNGLVDVDVYRTDWISPKWYIRIEVTKTIAPPALTTSYFAGWLLAFRRFTSIT